MEINLKELKKEYNKACEKMDRVFGHNCEKTFGEFSRLAKLGAKIQFVDYYSCKVELPEQKDARDKCFIYLLNMCPSACKQLKTHNMLFVEWHW